MAKSAITKNEKAAKLIKERGVMLSENLSVKAIELAMKDSTWEPYSGEPGRKATDATNA